MPGFVVTLVAHEMRAVIPVTKRYRLGGRSRYQQQLGNRVHCPNAIRAELTRQGQQFRAPDLEPRDGPVISGSAASRMATLRR